MTLDIAKILADVTPGSVGVWTLVLMFGGYLAREWRETRKLSIEDRIARRNGYARQVEELHGENRALRTDIMQLHKVHEEYRKLCQAENDQLREMVIDLNHKVVGLERRIASDAVEIAKLQGRAA